MKTIICGKFKFHMTRIPSMCGVFFFLLKKVFALVVYFYFNLPFTKNASFTWEEIYF